MKFITALLIGLSLNLLSDDEIFVKERISKLASQHGTRMREALSKRKVAPIDIKFGEMRIEKSGFLSVGTKSFWKVEFGKDVELVIDESTGDVTKCSFFKLRTAVRAKFPLTEKQKEKIYSEETAKHIAIQFFEDVTGRKPNGKPEITFSPRYNTNGFSINDWLINWPVLTKDGIPFLDDYYSVSVIDGDGAYGLFSELQTEYPEKTEIVEAKEQVFPLALRELKRRLGSSRILKDLMPDGLVDEQHMRLRLMVVRPNNFFDTFALEKVVSLPKGRVAWVLEAVVNTPNRECSVTLYLDAATRECLGGDGCVLRELQR